MQAPEPVEPWTRLASPESLEALGAAIAGRLEAGEAVCLCGPLGAGKSTLARGLVRALAGAHEDVPSPTFTLMQTYAGPRFPVAHFDLYRLKRAEEAFEVGLDEALDVGAAVVEWSERLEGALPPNRLDVRLALTDPALTEAAGPVEGRWARWRGFGRWQEKAVVLGG